MPNSPKGPTFFDCSSSTTNPTTAPASKTQAGNAEERDRSSVFPMPEILDTSNISPYIKSPNVNNAIIAERILAINEEKAKELPKQSSLTSTREGSFGDFPPLEMQLFSSHSTQGDEVASFFAEKKLAHTPRVTEPQAIRKKVGSDTFPM